MTRALVWDIGNVLLNWSPDNLYRRLIPDDAAREAFYARLPLDEMNLAGDRDGDLQAKVEALAEAHPEDAPLILPWWAGWDRMCGGLIEDSVALRDRLRAAGVRTWALTNFAADSWERAIVHYPALAEFDGLIVSGREGTVKPEPAIYQRLETRSGIAPEDLFLIDDRPANIEAARARGWGGHIFENVDGLRPALAAEGFPI
ncbi:MAG: HAD family phosphatase [Pseudomonadota bacterium]